jgi:hypothetical protein
VRADGREVQRWSDSYSSAIVRPDLDLTIANLGGDSADELVVATLNAVSNGMAVSYWTVCVLDASKLSQPPACVEVEDYGRMGFLTWSTGDTRCRLLQTDWRWGSEAGRGDGLYLVGQWLAYEGGRLYPDLSRPVLARRYLYSFQRERGWSPNGPLLWFAHNSTKVVSCPDPLCE